MYYNELLNSEIDTSWIVYFTVVDVEVDVEVEVVLLIFLVISTNILSYFNNDSTLFVLTVYWPKTFVVISVTKLFPLGLLGFDGTKSYGTDGCSVIIAIYGTGFAPGILYPIALYLFWTSVFL